MSAEWRVYGCRRRAELFQAGFWDCKRLCQPWHSDSVPRGFQSAADNRRMQISETAEVIYFKNNTMIYSMPKPTSMLQRPRKYENSRGCGTGRVIKRRRQRCLSFHLLARYIPSQGVCRLPTRRLRLSGGRKSDITRYSTNLFDVRDLRRKSLWDLWDDFLDQRLILHSLAGFHNSRKGVRSSRRSFRHWLHTGRWSLEWHISYPRQQSSRLPLTRPSSRPWSVDWDWHEFSLTWSLTIPEVSLW